MFYKTYKRLFTYSRPYRGKMIFASVLNVVSNLLSTGVIAMVLPLTSIVLGVSKEIPFSGAATGNNEIKRNVIDWYTSFFTHGTPMENLVKLCVYIFSAYLLKNVIGYASSYVMAIVEGGMVRDLRNSVFEKLSTLSIDYYYDRKAGQLLSRITNDVGSVNSTLTSSIMTLLGQPLQLIGFLYILFTLSPSLAIISFGIALASMLLINLLGKTLKNASQKVMTNAGDILTVAQEMISGIKVVKSFGMERYEVGRFKKETQFNYGASLKLSRIRGTIGPLNELLAMAGFIAILWFGGQKVFNHDMTGPGLFLFLVSLIWLMQPVRILSELGSRLHEGAASADNLFSILDAMPSVTPGKLAAPAKHDSPIVFENVHFKYGSATENAVDGINLEIFPNEVLALVGPSGAGKTTLVDLLARFYDPTDGAIILGGRNIREYDLESLRKLFGIVTQDTVLFHDTILNNIAYGNRDASQEMVFEAARAANAHEFILQMPQGYETLVGDRGVRLSGGQRQRIAIARALLKNPPILIFDEATSALDTENEMLVQQAIQALLSHRTAVVIAHRLSTIQQADRIVVVEDGKIVEIGTHTELLGDSTGLYHKLYNIQKRAATEVVVDIGN